MHLPQFLTRLSLAAGLAGLIGLLPGCATAPTKSPSQAQSGTSAKPLRVGITVKTPPFVIKQNGEYRGIEVELARQLAGELGRPLKFVEVAWERQIPALEARKIDLIMSGMSITAARQYQINFTNPYLISGQIALVRQNEAAKFHMFLLYDKYRLGVQKGTTGDYYAQQFLHQTVRVEVADPEAAARDLVAKRIDVFLCDAPVNWWLAAQYEQAGLTVVNQNLTTEYLAWGVRKDDPDLLNAANQFIDTHRKDGGLQAVISRWMPVFVQ